MGPIPGVLRAGSGSSLTQSEPHLQTRVAIVASAVFFFNKTKTRGVTPYTLLCLTF